MSNALCATGRHEPTTSNLSCDNTAQYEFLYENSSFSSNSCFNKFKVNILLFTTVDCQNGERIIAKLKGANYNIKEN